MVRVADFRLTKAAAHVRAHGVKGSRELVVNFIQPLQSRVPRPMRDFLKALTLLLFDFASTIVFLVLFLLTHNTILSVGLGIAFSLAQTGTQFIRRKPIGTMEWLSLFLVTAPGTATLLLEDPRYVLLRACDLVNGQASTGHSGHQCSHAPTAKGEPGPKK